MYFKIQGTYFKIYALYFLRKITSDFQQLTKALFSALFFRDFRHFRPPLNTPYFQVFTVSMFPTTAFLRIWKQELENNNLFSRKTRTHVLKQIGDVSKRAVFISVNPAKGSVSIPCRYRSMREIFLIYKYACGAEGEV